MILILSIADNSHSKIAGSTYYPNIFRVTKVGRVFFDSASTLHLFMSESMVVIQLLFENSYYTTRPESQIICAQIWCECRSKTVDLHTLYLDTG